MAHFVYFSVGMPSTLHGTIGLCRRLSDAGHQITVVSHRDIGADIAKAGFAFRELLADREYAAQAAAMSRPRLKNLTGLASWAVKRRRIRKRSIQQREIETIASELEADAFLVDLECHFALIALSALNTPIMLISFFFSIFRETGVPPLDLPLQPDDTAQSDRFLDAAWRKLHREHLIYILKQRYGPQRLRHALMPVGYGTRQMPDLTRIAKARGVKIREIIGRRHWLRPYTPAEIPVLSLNVRELDFPNVRHPRMHYAGPAIDMARKEPTTFDSSLQQWKKFKLRRQENGLQGRPLIYCSQGSILRPDSTFFKALSDIFRKRNDWDLVLGLGATVEPPPEFAALPNVLCLNWAPQLDVLSHASCAVHCGGVSTVNECLYCGVPMVIYPQVLDQEGCAARVSFHGLGLRIHKNTWCADDLEQAITDCLENENIAKNVRLMKDVIHQYDEQSVAVKLVEQLTLQRKAGQGWPSRPANQ